MTPVSRQSIGCVTRILRLHPSISLFVNCCLWLFYLQDVFLTCGYLVVPCLDQIINVFGSHILTAVSRKMSLSVSVTNVCVDSIT